MQQNPKVRNRYRLAMKYRISNLPESTDLRLNAKKILNFVPQNSIISLDDF